MTITHDAFVKKYMNRYVEFADPSNPYQCIDLMRKYIVEVLGKPPYSIPSALYAKDVYRNFVSNKDFIKIPNTATNVPKKGDIFFFKNSLTYPWNFGWAGHVGIVESADVFKLVLFNQNYPVGRPCMFRAFTYKDALGWIRKVG